MSVFISPESRDGITASLEGTVMPNFDTPLPACPQPRQLEPGPGHLSGAQPTPRGPSDREIELYFSSSEWLSLEQAFRLVGKMHHEWSEFTCLSLLINVIFCVKNLLTILMKTVSQKNRCKKKKTVLNLTSHWRRICSGASHVWVDSWFQKS